MAEAEGRFRRRASDELATVERQFASLSEDLARARTQRSRTVVKAPSDGIVKGLRNSSPGWVVKPGESILEVVPDEDEIMVEARLNPNDRGFIEVGQQARVKITAYDYLRYGAVDGTGQAGGGRCRPRPAISSGAPYYRLLISMSQVPRGRDENCITAGMESEVDVRGHRPVHLVHPATCAQLRREAFREP